MDELFHQRINMDTHALVTRFYTAFQDLNWQDMNPCYHPEATFHDPVFRTLTSKEVRAMWHLLCTQAREFSLLYSVVEASPDKARCHWQAHYTFSKTGRLVINDIQANFVMKDGLIYAHHDEFDLWRWSRMALGLPGIVLGWSPYLKNKLHLTARKGLDRFIAQHPQYQ